MKWILQHGVVDASAAPVVMGVLNVTPDSFSDGGEFLDCDAAVARADAMVAEGAGILDIGAESTRPGAEAVTEGEQIRRVEPVISRIRARHPLVPISIDTRSACVAHCAMVSGADIINDVSSLRDDPEMVRVAREAGAGVILMHMRGEPKSMQSGLGDDAYDDVVAELAEFLAERVAFARTSGLALDRIAVDPGIGFGKSVEHNLVLIKRLGELRRLGLPIVFGASRKRFLDSCLGRPDPKDRLAGSLACAALAAMHGANVVRAHDVRETVDVVRMVAAVVCVS